MQSLRYAGYRLFSGEEIDTAIQWAMKDLLDEMLKIQVLLEAIVDRLDPPSIGPTGP